ncbi:MAG: GMC family oxidoreductase N-terminal domain-containing protein [Thermodesulfobacteriota bacterium]|nr:GMC family oxidoreductase N-terminal domain-containing protein [Thermodesulfobacteriota bacterium]
MHNREHDRDRKYEFIIIGSGPGGATLAMELAKHKKDVLVVEKGKYEQEFGNLRDIARFYDVRNSSPQMRASQEGILLFRAFMAGGTAVVSCGNGIRCLETELSDLGIFLEKEFVEAELEMNIAPLPESLLSEGSQKLKWAAEALGYGMKLMPKFINFEKCKKCGKCIAGCPNGAKWSAIDYIEKAIRCGASIDYETIVRRVLVKRGRVEGIAVIGTQGETKILADTVIIAAGGLETPLILNRSGIEGAGKNLFLDLYINTFGEGRGVNQLHEPVMAMVNDEFFSAKGFIISPFINRWKIGRFSELGKAGLHLNQSNLIGFMTKIADESKGCVFPDGTISKVVTKRDRERLCEGVSLSREIMIKAGAPKESLIDSKIQGAHPGGTAAIGKIVDKDLQTNIENLFVCDASVLPLAPGLPPILTIVALAKRLSKMLIT